MIDAKYIAERITALRIQKNVSEYKMPYSVYIDTGNNKRIKSITHNMIFM